MICPFCKTEQNPNALKFATEAEVLGIPRPAICRGCVEKFFFSFKEADRADVKLKLPENQMLFFQNMRWFLGADISRREIFRSEASKIIGASNLRDSISKKALEDLEKADQPKA